jgi:endonuclease/exonuclease/phosphatase family metal-dependent hydrolase
MLLTISGLFLADGLAAQPVIDGSFEDWEGRPPVTSDPPGDQSLGRIDFGRLWADNDDRFLYLSFETGGEIVLQDPNQVTLYLDTDADASTGMIVAGLGAELVWRFGERSGAQIHEGRTYPARHIAFGLVSAPTVSSRRFEMAFSLDAGTSSRPVFSGDTVRVALLDAFGGDMLPDSGTTATYRIDRSAVRVTHPVELAKASPEDVRILSYNVERDGLFDGSRFGAYSRILSALDPDIVGFQEIYAHTVGETRFRVEQFLPSDPNQQWYATGVGDLRLVSRFPVSRIAEMNGSAAFLVDLRPRIDHDILVIVAHLKCCSDGDPERQRQVDELMAFVRDGQSNGHFEPDTPFIILGDLNLVGDAQQLATLLTGDIRTRFFQPSFSPDWDGTPITALPARVTGLPMAFTWWSPFNLKGFSPGRLDYVLFSDSVLEPGHHYVLFTPGMTPDELDAFGLRPGDVETASDHLPLIADFRTRAVTSAEGLAASPKPSSEVHIFPNPASADIVRLSIPGDATSVDVLDIHGRLIRSARLISLAASTKTVALDTSALTPGMYFLRVRTSSSLGSGVFVKLR